MSELSQQAVLSCVTRGLSTIGAEGAEATFYHLERQFGLARVSIPLKPASFTLALRALFGVGSGVLMNAILREIRSTDIVEKDEHVALFALGLEAAAGDVESGIM